MADRRQNPPEWAGEESDRGNPSVGTLPPLGDPGTLIETLPQRFAEERLFLKQQLHQDAAARGAADRQLLRTLARCERASIWLDEQRSPSQWVGEQLGISQWRAARLLNAARAIEPLPYIGECLSNGSLSLDKVVELVRFASPDDEVDLAKWARRVNVSTIRQRADRASDINEKEAKSAHEGRSVSFMSLDDQMGQMLAILPHTEFETVKQAIHREADLLPADPEAESGAPRTAEATFEQRCADALVALAGTRIAEDQDPDRATILVDAPLAVLAGGKGSASIAGGPAIHPEVARRLCCDGRIDVCFTDEKGSPQATGRMKRMPSARVRRAVFKRDDYTCTFPNCTMRRFLTPHHLTHWIFGGPSEVFNLITLCAIHHRLIHEGMWSVSRAPTGEIRWYRPSGRLYDPGAPPPDPREVHPEESYEPATLIELRDYHHALRLVGLL